MSEGVLLALDRGQCWVTDATAPAAQSVRSTSTLSTTPVTSIQCLRVRVREDGPAGPVRSGRTRPGAGLCPGAGVSRVARVGEGP